MDPFSPISASRAALMIGAANHIVHIFRGLSFSHVFGISLFETLPVAYLRRLTVRDTAHCDHYCLMCSQPPRDVQDGWIVDGIMAAIPLIDRATPEILFTGGELTLLGARLLELVRRAKSYLPETSLHILTNGRSYKDNEYASDFAQIAHHDLMFGIGYRRLHILLRRKASC